MNDLFGWKMSVKLPVNGFKWVESTSQFNENFLKVYNEKSNERYLLGVDIKYPEKLHKLHNNLTFLPKRMEIKEIGKLIAKMRIKNEYVIYIRNLKQALSNGLVLKKVLRNVKFNQKAWLKPLISTQNQENNVNNGLEKHFFKFIGNAFFEKALKNVRKYRDMEICRYLN